MSEGTSTIGALSGLAEKVARAAGLLVAMSALAYFIGFRLQSSYLAEIGAPWAISLYSTADLIREGQWVVIIVASALTISIISQLMAEEQDKPYKGREDVWLLSAGAALLAAGYGSEFIWNDKHLENGLTLLAGLLMVGAAGFTIGDLVSDSRAKNFSWRSKHIKTLLVAYACAATVAPQMIGKNMAQLSLDPIKTKLPLVNRAGEQESWRLVCFVGGSYLLAQISEDRESRRFVVVPETGEYVVFGRAK